MEIGGKESFVECVIYITLLAGIGRWAGSWFGKLAGWEGRGTGMQGFT